MFEEPCLITKFFAGLSLLFKNSSLDSSFRVFRMMVKSVDS